MEVFRLKKEARDEVKRTWYITLRVLYCSVFVLQRVAEGSPTQLHGLGISYGKTSCRLRKAHFQVQILCLFLIPKANRNPWEKIKGVTISDLHLAGQKADSSRQKAKQVPVKNSYHTPVPDTVHLFIRSFNWYYRVLRMCKAPH